MMSRNYVRPTRDEQARMDRIKKMGCVLSKLRAEKGLPVPRGRVELHHLVKPGKREGHNYTVALNTYYHQGRPIPYPCDSRTEAREFYGASISDGSKAFLESHGVTQWDLWEITQTKLGASTERPTSKIIPRQQVA